jgi:hypothetical protein
MSRVLSASLRVLADIAYSDNLDLQTQQAPINYNGQMVLGTGSGANQGQLVFSDTRTLAASANEDLDLNGATLVDAFGAALNFTKIRGLIVRADPLNTNNVIVGGAASNGVFTMFGAATHTVTVRPGGVLALFAPDNTAYAAVATTADLLRIANGGAGSTVTYDIIVIGS